MIPAAYAYVCMFVLCCCM